MTVIDLSKLPSPGIIEALDFETIRERMIADLKNRLPEWNADLESDPAVKIIEVCAYRELLFRQRVNDAARSVMLAWATGSDLDNIGALFDVARHPGETDSKFRKRIQAGYHMLAAAGPSGAYVAHALAVDPAVTDVNVSSPAAGKVLVTILSHQIIDADLASEEETETGKALFPEIKAPSGKAVILARPDSPVITAVRKRLSSDDVRPLTDDVMTVSASARTFGIKAQIHIYPGPDVEVVSADMEKSLQAFLTNSREVGRDIAVSAIIAALSRPGVKSVKILEPASDIACQNTEIAVCTGFEKEIIRSSEI